MLAKHRDYLLHGTQNFHAHVQVNPIGQLDVDIVEKREHHSASFESLAFKKVGSKTIVSGCDEKNKKSKWQLTLAKKDAEELNLLIEEANEEYEILMRDLS